MATQTTQTQSLKMQNANAMRAERMRNAWKVAKSLGLKRLTSACFVKNTINVPANFVLGTEKTSRSFKNYPKGSMMMWSWERFANEGFKTYTFEVEDCKCEITYNDLNKIDGFWSEADGFSFMNEDRIEELKEALASVNIIV